MSEKPMEIRAFQLTPLDTLFCRDGRPFGASTVATSGLPNPQTVAGAFRTLAFRRLGISPSETSPRDWNRLILGMQVRGPWPMITDTTLKQPQLPQLLLPTPADVVRPKGSDGKIMRLRVYNEQQTNHQPMNPASPPTSSAAPKGWKTPPGFPDGFRPLWNCDKNEEADQIEPVGGFITHSGMQAYLRGQTPDLADFIQSDSIITHESRTGIAVDGDSLTAAESQIYSIRMLRLKQGVCLSVKDRGPNAEDSNTLAKRKWDVSLYAEVHIPEESRKDADAVFGQNDSWTMPLGGEGKLVVVKPMEQIEWPDEHVSGDPAVLVLISPARFPKPYSIPDSYLLPSGWRLASAGVTGHVSVSGWDLKRRCPKPTRNYAAAGSVYFLESTDTNKASLPDDRIVTLGETRENIEGIEFVQGHGLCLKGVWPL